MCNIPAQKKSELVNTVLRRYQHNHGNIATGGSPKSGLCTTLIEISQGFIIVHSTIDSTAHSRPLNSLEHCYAQPDDNIQPGLDSNPVATTGSNEPSGPASEKVHDVLQYVLYSLR